MNLIKRTGIIIAVFLVLLILSESFVVESINDRGIVLGVGFDYADGKYTVTCEMLTGSSNSENTDGSFSTVVQGSGETVSLALQDVYRITGRQPSLGLCSVIVLGKDLYTSLPIKDCLAYFTFSDAFRDGSMVVCAEDSAEEILTTASSLNQSPSFALSEIIQKSNKSTTVPKNNLQRFMNSQINLSGGGFLNVVKTVDSNISNSLSSSQSSSEKGNFSVKSIAVFDKFNYVKTLPEELNSGYCLLMEKGVYQTFPVPENCDIEDILAPFAVLAVVDKKVDKEVSINDGTPELSIKIQVKVERSYTDNNAKLSPLMPKKDTRITPEMLSYAEQNAKESVEKTIAESMLMQCDFCQIKNDFYRKYGADWKEIIGQNPTFLEDNLVVKTQIKCYQ